MFKLGLVASIMAAGLLSSSAADAPKPVEKSWWTDISVSPYGAVVHPNFDKPLYGAGLDLGYSINKTVSLHGSVLSYEGPDNWKGSAVDEGSLLFRADLIKYSQERFVAYVLGGGDRSFELDDWAFGVGIGAELRFTKNLSVGVDSRIRAWFNQEKDVISRGYVSVRF
jgi:hypothetical protein